MRLQGNKVIITGGASGIGLELSKKLSNQGNEIVICGRSQEKLDRVKLENPEFHCFACNLSQENGRLEFANWITKNHPDSNILINNAAIAHKADFFSDAHILEKAELEMRTNFIAPVALSKLLYPILKNHDQAAIVYITTGLVYAPRAIYPIYCASKAALHSFTQTLRIQAESTSVAIYEVLMPAVNTPWHKGNPPKIAISPQQAVDEMCKGLERGKYEIRVCKVRLLYLLARIAPSLALKKMNSLE